MSTVDFEENPGISQPHTLTSHTVRPSFLSGIVLKTGIVTTEKQSQIIMLIMALIFFIASVSILAYTHRGPREIPYSELSKSTKMKLPLNLIRALNKQENYK